MTPHPKPAIESLREEISRIEGRDQRIRSVLPFGIEEIDSRLPGGGLSLGALHEVAGGGSGAIHGAEVALFAAGIAARTKGKILWCVAQLDLFAPALAQAGLPPDRVICIEAGNNKTVLSCMEEALRHGGLGAVVAEVGPLSMTASRRIQLAAEGSGSIAIVLRRWRRQADAAEFTEPSGAMTRWRISSLPSAPLPVPGIGRPRWRVELIRARGGEHAAFEVEACDETGCLALPADLVHGPAEAEDWGRSASG